MQALKALAAIFVEIFKPDLVRRHEAAKMSLQELIAQINYDAEDFRFNTIYSQEYDKRRAAINKGHNDSVYAHHCQLEDEKG